MTTVFIHTVRILHIFFGGGSKVLAGAVGARELLFLCLLENKGWRRWVLLIIVHHGYARTKPWAPQLNLHIRSSCRSLGQKPKVDQVRIMVGASSRMQPQATRNTPRHGEEGNQMLHKRNFSHWFHVWMELELRKPKGNGTRSVLLRMRSEVQRPN